MRRRVFFQIRQRQLEKCGGRTQAVFLQMDKCTSQLDQAFVKISIHAVLIGQPQIFQHFVGFVKLLLVEQRKVTGITRINSVTGELLFLFSDAIVFIHVESLCPNSKAGSQKSRAAFNKPKTSRADGTEESTTKYTKHTKAWNYRGDEFHESPIFHFV